MECVLVKKKVERSVISNHDSMNTVLYTDRSHAARRDPTTHAVLFIAGQKTQAGNINYWKIVGFKNWLSFSICLCHKYEYDICFLSIVHVLFEYRLLKCAILSNIPAT